jgi:DNA polymerase-3 subunit gamma/tau
MAAQALYRRWRSRTFDQIIGQDHVTHTLLNALRAGRVGHAYLFAGPRGTGKTTTARVLAKAVNCLDPQNGEPCNRCNICRSLNEGRSLDLIEIDAASNRGIDEIRALREKIAFAPSECRYKVYVIDEVHMLTNEAFNALLKTLEEPPPHAIFVMATTEPQRIPLTVLSRCQRFDFHRVPLSGIKQKLELICQQESIRIQPAALEAIARHATGSLRDAESLLDQLVSFGMEEITLDDVRRVLGSAPEEVIAGIIQALVAGDVGAGLKWINEALDGGVEARQLTREVLDYLRGLLLVKSGSAALLDVTPESLKDMMQQADRIALGRLLHTARLFNGAANLLKTGVHGQLPLELAFVEAALPEESANLTGKGAGSSERTPPERPAPTPSVRTVSTPPMAEASPSARAEMAAPAVTAATPVQPPSTSPVPEADSDASAKASAAVGVAADRAVEKQSNSSAETAASTSAETVASPNQVRVDVTWLKNNWGQLLQAVRRRSLPVEALLKSCEPVAVQDNVVTLGFYGAWHKERMSGDKNRVVVEEALAEVTGKPYGVKVALYEGNRQERERQATADRHEELLRNPVVREAIEEFGAKVVDVQ